MILDTQFLGALVDGSDGARAKAAEIDDRQVPTRVPAAVVWEAYTGIGNAASAETARQLRGLYERLLGNHSTVALTPDVSRRAGELNGRHLKSDTPPDLDGTDSIVAAHGLLLDEPILSNDGDFRDVDGLEVIAY